MRSYMVRFLKRIYPAKGQAYLDELLAAGTITQEEYDAVIA